MTEQLKETLYDEELVNLATTKFIPSVYDDDAIETARSGDSCVLSCQPINVSSVASGVDFMESLCLAGDEAEYFEYFKNQPISDEAGGLENMLKFSTIEMLKTPTLWMRIPEESMRWERTNRESELNLINYAVKNIDSRPSQLHFNCKRLVEIDVPNIIKDCLLVDPAQEMRSLLRLSIRTEMPFCQILSQLDTLSRTIPGFEIQKGMVTALLANDIYPDCTKTIRTANRASHKLFTSDYNNYSYFEGILENIHIHKMTSNVRLKCTIRGRKHVRVNVTISNDITTNKKRLKIIDIEQHVWPANFSAIRRHVTFAPLEEHIIHEYEIPNDVPFVPLTRSKPTFDLIEYLADVDDRIKTIAQRNLRNME